MRRQTYLVTSLFTRLAVVCFWVTLILGVLYLPRFTALAFPDKTINVFAWGDSIDLNIFRKFEKKTGIKVNLNYYSSNEELLVKLKATGGEGYDLIMPSDYAVTLLAEEGLIKPLNLSKLPFWKDLNPLLLNHPHDPNNIYSIPFVWEVFGLGIDRNYFKDKPFSPSWKAIFDEKTVSYKIAMNNDPIEAVLFSSLYLYGKTDKISDAEFQGIRSLLLLQRKWVEAYANFRADYFLATGNCPVAIASSEYIWRTRKMFPHIDFVIPEEGSFITMENFCIPTKSSKEDYIYMLLAALYSKESIQSQYNHFGLFPVTLSSIDSLKLEPYERKLLQMSKEEFKKFHFIKNILPQQKVRDLWVEVKSF